MFTTAVLYRFRSAVLPALVAVGGLWGCPSPSEPNVGDRVFGTWAWVEATGGLGGDTRTPQTEGVTRRLIITPPDRIVLVENDRVHTATTFLLLPARDPGGTFVQARLRYGTRLMGRTEQFAGFDPDGALILTDPCCDGFVYRWVRVGQPAPR